MSRRCFPHGELTDSKYKLNYNFHNYFKFYYSLCDCKFQSILVLVIGKILLITLNMFVLKLKLVLFTLCKIGLIQIEFNRQLF